MYIYRNNNPIELNTDDCVVRATSTVLDIPWERAYMELCQIGLMLYDMPHKDSVLSAYLRKHGFKRYAISNNCPDCFSIKDFCREYPIGTYVVLTSGHAIAVIDGNYYDTSDSGNEIPMMYWKKER